NGAVRQFKHGMEADRYRAIRPRLGGCHHRLRRHPRARISMSPFSPRLDQRRDGKAARQFATDTLARVASANRESANPESAKLGFILLAIFFSRVSKRNQLRLFFGKQLDNLPSCFLVLFDLA